MAEAHQRTDGLPSRVPCSSPHPWRQGALINLGVISPLLSSMKRLSYGKGDSLWVPGSFWALGIGRAFHHFWTLANDTEVNKRKPVLAHLWVMSGIC